MESLSFSVNIHYNKKGRPGGQLLKFLISWNIHCRRRIFAVFRCLSDGWKMSMPAEKLINEMVIKGTKEKAEGLRPRCRRESCHAKKQRRNEVNEWKEE